MVHLAKEEGNEEAVYGSADSVCPERGRIRCFGDGDLSKDGHKRCDILQLAQEVWDAEIRRLKALEEENRQLKRLVADLSLDKHMLQDVMSKKF